MKLGGPAWRRAKGQPLTPRHVATLLEGFRIRAKQIRQGAATRKGYMRADFTDAFRRYLPSDPKQPSHRAGPAARAIPTGSRRSGVVSGDGGPPRREPPRTVSDVSDAPLAEERGANGVEPESR